MKDIDAEKLYEYLEQVSEFYPRYADNFLDNAVINVINGIKTFIASLQQEQQETNMKSPFTGGKVAILSREEEVMFRGEKVKITRKYYRCEDTGREFTDSKLDDDMMWDTFRAYCEKKGMTSFTDIVLKQEQPEVDLKEEIASFFSKNPIPCEHITDWPLLKNTAIHFYELGLNARKED